MLRGVWEIFKKDISYEVKRWEILTILIFFALATVFVLDYTISLPKHEKIRISPSLFWILIMLMSILGLNKTASLEYSALKALLLAPLPREAILFGKILSTSFFLYIATLIVGFITIAIFGISFPIDKFLPFLIVSLLVNFGFATIGTLLTMICRVARNREILFTLGFFPLVVTPLLAGVNLTRELLSGNSVYSNIFFQIVVIFDLVFLSLSFILFSYLLEL